MAHGLAGVANTKNTVQRDRPKAKFTVKLQESALEAQRSTAHASNCCSSCGAEESQGSDNGERAHALNANE